MGRWAGQIQQNYPSEALRNEESGTVRLRVTVNPLGRVSECTVTGSSGSPSLDAAACDGMIRYAEFDPARDADGVAIYSNYNTAIRYQIPEPVPVRANGNLPAMIETESWAPALFQAMGLDIEELDGLTEDDMGVVLVSLRIDPAGSVERCVVLLESGDAAIDTKACSAATKYARFEKATGDDAKARFADLPVPYAK